METLLIYCGPVLIKTFSYLNFLKLVNHEAWCQHDERMAKLKVMKHEEEGKSCVINIKKSLVNLRTLNYNGSFGDGTSNYFGPKM